MTALTIAAAFIRSQEGLRLACYDDATGRPLAASEIPKGTPSIGYGHTRGVKPGDRCTREQAEAWLLEDMQEATETVAEVTCAKMPLTGHQAAALISLQYNAGAVTHHDFRAALLTGDPAALFVQWRRWNHMDGKVNAGLVWRREAEIALWNTPDNPAAPPPVPTPAVLRRGSTGRGVAGLQIDLMELGYLEERYPADGDFGPVTEAAVRAFQADHPALVVDGIAGPKTLTGIEVALADLRGRPQAKEGGEA